MNLFNLFKRQGTAPVARDRLQILLAYERGSTRGAPDLLAILREEILTAVGRHVEIDSDRVNVRMDRGDKVSTLEVDIEIPCGWRQAEADANGRSPRIVPHPDCGTRRARGRGAATVWNVLLNFFAKVLSCP